MTIALQISSVYCDMDLSNSFARTINFTRESEIVLKHYKSVALFSHIKYGVTHDTTVENTFIFEEL